MERFKMVKKISAVIALTVLLAGCSPSDDANKNLSENQSQGTTQVASVDDAQQSVMGSTSSSDNMQQQDAAANTGTDASASSTNNGDNMQAADQGADSAATTDDENSDQE
jgi:PBP1b-binding outer membrane lipoprotein LpoB